MPLLEILMTKVVPTITRTDSDVQMASNILKISPI